MAIERTKRRSQSIPTKQSSRASEKRAADKGSLSKSKASKKAYGTGTGAADEGVAKEIAKGAEGLMSLPEKAHTHLRDAFSPVSNKVDDFFKEWKLTTPGGSGEKAIIGLPPGWIWLFGGNEDDKKKPQP